MSLTVFCQIAFCCKFPFKAVRKCDSFKLKFQANYWAHQPGTLHLELRSVMCNGAEENHAHRCDPYDPRVQEQPLFLVCSSINIFTSMGLDP